MRDDDQGRDELHVTNEDGWALSKAMVVSMPNFPVEAMAGEMICASALAQDVASASGQRRVDTR